MGRLSHCHRTPQWTKRQVTTLTPCRERLWAILSERCPGTVRTDGAFYFLARLPAGVAEEEAVRVLATEYRVLCTPGRCVGWFCDWRMGREGEEQYVGD